MLKAGAHRNSRYFHVSVLSLFPCVLFSNVCLSPPFSHTTRLWSVSLVVLGLVPGSLLSGWGPPSHPLHPFAASQRWHPLPRAGGTGWMCAAQLHEAAVTLKHIYCQYSTLGLWCYYCWTEKCHRIFSWSCKWFVMYVAVELLKSHSCCDSCAGHQFWNTLSGCIIMGREKVRLSTVQSLMCELTPWTCWE